METFDTVDEMWISAASDILIKGSDVPSRDGKSVELMGYVARLLNPRANFMFNPIRKMHPSYAAGEMLWYLSGEERIDSILPYAPQYERFAEKRMIDDGYNVLVANGAYGNRWRKAIKETFGVCHNDFDQLEHVIKLLKENPATRQAVVTMYHPQDLYRAERSKDLPCTLCLNFLIRDSKLNLIATMRSNDHWLGFPYDVFCFTTLQQLLAEQLGVDVGWYQHQAMSLHLYDRNIDKAKNAISPPVFSTGGNEFNKPKVWKTLDDRIKEALPLEIWNRTEKVAAFEIEEVCGEGTLMSELLLMAAMKWDFTKSTYKRFSSKLMKQYVREEFQYEVETLPQE